MKFTIEIDPEVNPDAVGEYLRSTFFDEKEYSLGPEEGYSEETFREMGCYSAFDWAEGVEPLEEILQEESTCKECRGAGIVAAGGGTPSYDYVCTCTEKECWTRGKKIVDGSTAADRVSGRSCEIECRYYWDGDGTLIFILPGGKYLINTDCKKDHDWRCVDSPEDF